MKKSAILIVAALASATSLTGCGNGHRSANGDESSQVPIVSQTISEGGQPSEGAASPTTPASQAGEPGKYFKDANKPSPTVIDRYCGVVSGPVGWPIHQATGKWDVGIRSDYGLLPSRSDDCPLALRYLQDFFAHSASAQVDSWKTSYSYGREQCLADDNPQVGSPNLQCHPVSKFDQPDTSIDLYTAYPR